MEADFAILMEPSDAVVEAGCQGTMRVDVRTHGRAGALRPQLEGRQRHPRRRRGPGPAQRLRAAQAGDRRAGVPRGAQRGLHQRRRRRQRAARRVRRVGQLPVRARPVRGRGRGSSCASSSTASTSPSADSAPGALPGLGLPAAKAFVEAVGGTRSARSSGGPTWPASARSAYPPSTSGPATRCSPTSRRSTSRSSHIERCERQLRALAGRRVVTAASSRARVTLRRKAVDRAPPTSGCSTPAARPTGSTPTRGGCCASRRSSSRASARWPSSGPAIARLRLGPDPDRRPVLRDGRAGRPRAGRGRVRGHHRRRPGRDGGGQQGRPRGRRHLGRPRDRAALRGRASTRTSTSASTSATSSPARRCS